MERRESKYFQTAERMDKALLTLLEKKDFSFITVKEICQEAGVNRSTFYLHYETIDDLLCECAEYLNGHFLSHMPHEPGKTLPKLSTCPVEELDFLTPEYLEPYLSYVKEHRRLFCTALKNPAALHLDGKYRGLVQYFFVPVFRRFRVPEGEWEYRVHFYLQGIMGIIMQWLEGGCKEEILWLSGLIRRCVLGQEDGADGE